MNILIYEAVTAGLLPKAETHALYEEANAMLEALIRDFGDLPGTRIVTPRDQDLPSLSSNPSLEVIDLRGHPHSPFERTLDLALIVAPETDELLYRLSRAADDAYVRRLGCDLQTIQETSNKVRCQHQLEFFGIPSAPIWLNPSEVPDLQQGYVIKPIDGCGASNVRRVFKKALLTQDHRSLIQAWVEGIDASALCLFTPQEARVLSVNRQAILWNEAGFAELTGVDTGGFEEARTDFEVLLPIIQNAFPGLSGIVGVDFMMTNRGPIVIEINPRITSAYPDLRRVLGYNPMEHWLRALSS